MKINSTEAYNTSAPEASRLDEESYELVPLVSGVISVIAIIVILFWIGIQIDRLYQQQEHLLPRSTRRKQRKLKWAMSLPGQARGKSRKEDSKALASDMCPNGASDTGFKTICDTV
ncbi:PREDICTED: uncharacterized protein LOC106741692 [Dinoponera quadriceps]|uniref:Uncharacterized protein LOC106741692 n=1 Tax=Dinoponera quadriceps TaxID=609295 RepID=A0A6P3WUT9_DINQU|nr:PREDICTED: uncharacterized protein LOC106741692 [Dinoponera quadriceps]